MATEIKIPSPGESISEVEIASWFVESGDHVEKDQEIGEIESEKATLPLIAEDSGEIEILKQEGDTVAVGTVVSKIDNSKEGKKKEETGKDKPKEKEKPEKEKTEVSEQKKEKGEDIEEKDKETQTTEIADNDKV